MRAISFLVLLSAITLGIGKQKKKEALNRKTVPFWLQDETDGANRHSYMTTVRELYEPEGSSRSRVIRGSVS